jgi:tol-pal system protein YbgF
MMTVMRATLPTLTLALVLAVPAAGFAQNRVEQQMMAELRMLQEQLQQQRLAINTLADAIKAISAKQDEQANGQRKAFADQKVLTDAITDSIRVLREKGDDTNVRIATLSNQLEGTRQAMQSLQTSVVQAMAAVTQPANPAPTDPATGAAPPQTPAINPAGVQSPKVLYDKAFGDFSAAQYELAIQGFKAYLLTFPNSPDASQAQFYIGESHYNRGRYPEAIQAYREMIENYKTAAWLPDAYYKRGMSYRQLNDKERARADFDYVIKTFPDSTMAPLAKAARDSIK